MLKDAGIGGLIELGERFAGQRFEVVCHDDGRVELLPQVSSRAQAGPQGAPSSDPPDAWLPPGGYARSTQWARDNRVAIEAYAQSIEVEGTAAQQLQRFLAEGGATADAENLAQP